MNGQASLPTPRTGNSRVSPIRTGSRRSVGENGSGRTQLAKFGGLYRPARAHHRDALTSMCRCRAATHRHCGDLQIRPLSYTCSRQPGTETRRRLDDLTASMRARHADADGFPHLCRTVRDRPRAGVEGGSDLSVGQWQPWRWALIFRQPRSSSWTSPRRTGSRLNTTVQRIRDTTSGPYGAADFATDSKACARGSDRCYAERSWGQKPNP